MGRVAGHGGWTTVHDVHRRTAVAGRHSPKEHRLGSTGFSEWSFECNRKPTSMAKRWKPSGSPNRSAIGYCRVTPRSERRSDHPVLKLIGGDVLAFAVPEGVLPGLWATIGLIPLVREQRLLSPRYKHQLVEVVISGRSPAVGRLISELPSPGSPYRASLVGRSHIGQAPEIPLGGYRVQAGDSGILEVDDSFFYENRSETDFTMTKAIDGFQRATDSRALSAAVITVAMVIAAAIGITSMLNAALLATMAMLLWVACRLSGPGAAWTGRHW